MDFIWKEQFKNQEQHNIYSILKRMLLLVRMMMRRNMMMMVKITRCGSYINHVDS